MAQELRIEGLTESLARRAVHAVRHHDVDGDEIDFVLEDLLVTLEVDSFTFHATRRAFERDRRRDVDRQRAGHVVMRATYHEVTTEPHYFVARLAAVLARAQDQLRLHERAAAA